jgi:hypothetical protein
MQALSHKLLALIEVAAPQLARVDETASATPVRAGGWSRRQLLGHLIDSASNNHQRIVRASLQRELNFPGYDQNGNVRVQHFQTASWPMLLEMFLAYNRFLVHVIAHIPETKLHTICRIGAEAPITLEHLAKDYVKHLEHHLKLMGIEPRVTAAA